VTRTGSGYFSRIDERVGFSFSESLGSRNFLLRGAFPVAGDRFRLIARARLAWVVAVLLPFSGGTGRVLQQIEPRSSRVVVAAPAPVLPEPTAALTVETPVRQARTPIMPVAPRLPPVGGGGRWAVLVGINRTAGSPRLHGAVGDALTLEAALQRYGWEPSHVRVLLDGQASREAILHSIAWLADNAGTDGRAVFSFAGHTRKRGGVNLMVGADGRTIDAGTLSRSLGRVRAPMWATFPTCYAAGFAVPGIVGPGRVVTFGSSASSLTYETRSFGRSFLFEYMVAEGMLRQPEPPSVEQAFAMAHNGLERDYPSNVPLIDDRYEGEMTLTDASYWSADVPDPVAPSLEADDDQAADASGQDAAPASEEPSDPPGYPAPQSTPPPDEPQRSQPSNEDSGGGICTGSAEVGECP
jgi:hypothetical protein